MKPKRKVNSVFLTTLFLGFNSGAAIAAEEMLNNEQYNESEVQEDYYSISGKLDYVLDSLGYNPYSSLEEEKNYDKCHTKDHSKAGIEGGAKGGTLGGGYSRDHSKEANCTHSKDYSKDSHSKDYSKDPHSKDYSKDSHSKEYSRDPK